MREFWNLRSVETAEQSLTTLSARVRRALTVLDVQLRVPVDPVRRGATGRATSRRPAHLAAVRQELETLLDQVDAQLREVRAHAEQEILEAAEWLRRSELAVADGRDDLARQSLARRTEHAEAATGWQLELSEVEAMRDTLHAALDRIGTGLATTAATADQDFGR